MNAIYDLKAEKNVKFGAYDGFCHIGSSKSVFECSLDLVNLNGKHCKNTVKLLFFHTTSESHKGYYYLEHRMLHRI